MLVNYGDDSTNTAGLEKETVIKLGCKIMLRRNIDITLGLVNGAMVQLGQSNIVLIKPVWLRVF